MTTTRPPRDPYRVAAWLGLVGAAASYLAMAPTTVLANDNAEFATVAAGGGIPHPPGYPLYLMYLRAMRWIPGVSPAHSAALATSLLGIAVLVVLYRACLAWGIARPAALAAVGIYGASPIVLEIHTQAEVFALHGLLAAAVLWFAAPGGPLRGIRRVAMLGLLGGLGMAHNPTIALMAPIGLYGAVRGVREVDRHRVLAALVGVGAVALGFTPYLFLLTQNAGLMVWKPLHSFSALFDHALRRDYGGPFTPQPIDHHPNPWSLLAALGHAVVVAMRYWALLPLALGLGAALTQPSRSAMRWDWWLLLLSMILAGPVLIVRFNTGAVGAYLSVLQRFFLLPLLLATLPLALGLERLAVWLRPRLRRVRAPSVVASLALAVYPLGFVASWPHVSATHGAAVQRYFENTLALLPRDAVVLGHGDHQFFGFPYVQRVLGIRPDVVYIDYLQAASNQGQYDQVAARLGFDPFPPGAAPPMVRLARAVLDHGRPMFVDSPSMAAIVDALPNYPYGTVVRVVATRADVPTLDEIERENWTIDAKLVLDYPWPSVDNPWGVVVHSSYSQPWLMLNSAYASAGRPADAARCMQQAWRMVASQ